MDARAVAKQFARRLTGESAYRAIRRARVGWSWRRQPIERELWFAERIVREMGGGTVIDVGANVGVYSLFLARWAHTLVAFEAHPQLCESLRELLPSNCRVENVALGNAPGRLTLRVPIIRGGEVWCLGTVAALNSFQGEDVAGETRIAVEATTLDAFHAEHLGGTPPVTLVKVDVEGFEENVLEGASNTVRRFRPALLVETEYRHGANIPRIFERILGMGYVSSRVDDADRQLIAVESGEVRPLQTEDRMLRRQADPADHSYVNNFFFLPAERAESLRAATSR
jgi:FkbM family methyltransferase